MNKPILITIAVVVLIAGGILVSNRNTEPDTKPRRDQAPDFVLEDYAGTTHSLSDFSGKIVVANAWASWCPFCVDELPDFAQLQKEFPDDVVVIAINRRESIQTAKGYTDENGITNDLLYLLDPRDSFYQSIGGFSMPETLFIDAEGFIHTHKRGPMDLNEMRSRVEEILEA